ncbi:MAG: SAP domain-containing protein [Candidatus Thermoplasmatota archaeon]|nr:SAP domain-containing protein [Candidatus Thermoplasmatota archaeon]
MKVRDLQLYLRYSLSKDILLSFVRSNFLGLISIFVIVNVIDYYDYFEEDEMLYLVLTGVALLFSLVVFVKYRNPLSYYPRYVLFVKDRNDALVKMEPKIDPLITALGLIKPKDFVNVRYVVYPELDLGLDFDPNTGVISGYPLELGNHTSEVKMKFLGGEYSTTVRVEVIETAVLKERVEGSPFAAPRTVAQLLLREEDLKKREQEIDYRLQTKRMDMEEEFVSKQISLEQQFEVERAAFNVTLEKTKEEYEKILDNKDKQLVELKKDFDRRLEQNKNEYEQELAVFEANLDESKEKIDELETLALETGSAAANIEEQYVDMMDALATENPTEGEEEESKPEKTVDGSHEEEDLDDRISVDIDSASELLEREIDENTESLEASVENKTDSADSNDEELEDEPEEESEDDEYDYVSMTKAELVELAKKRGLAISGTKKKLISRLENND